MFLKRHIKLSFFCAFFSFLIAAEPSAFESQSGATKKDIKSLKDSSINLSSILLDLQGRVETLEQVQHGLQSLYDGQNQKIQNLLLGLENQTITAEELKTQIELLKESFAQMNEGQKIIKNKQDEFLLKIGEFEKKIREITDVSTNLNTLVLNEFKNVKDELKKQADVMLANQDNIQKLGVELEKILSDKKEEQKKNSFKSYEKNSDVLKEAKRLFWDKKFNEARDRFSWLVAQNYQKAEANYFLGQIASS